MKMLSRIGLVLSGALAVLAFQNCGKISIESVDLASKTQSHNTPHILAASNPVVGSDVDFSVFDDSVPPSASFAWSHKLGGVSGGCQVKTSTIARTYTLNCPSAADLVVSVTVMDGNKPIKVEDYSTQVLAVSPVPQPPGGSTTGTLNLTVDFNINAGTGSNPWNTAATIVETFIGQTVRINNLDNIRHRLHTGGAPCPHGADINPGASANCVVTRAFPATGVIYDHYIGTNARFFLVAYDGSALYATNCAGCHGALAATTISRASITMIKEALTTVPAMKSSTAIQGLTQRQLEAISYAVGGR